MKYKWVAGNCEYAEESQIALTIWHYDVDDSFTDPLDAVKSLANDLFQKFLNEWGWKREFKKTCKTCGHDLKQEAPGHEDFKLFIRGLSQRTVDSFGYDLNYWQPWDAFEIFSAPKDSIILIPEFDRYLAEVVDISFLKKEDQEFWMEERTNIKLKSYIEDNITFINHDLY